MAETRAPLPKPADPVKRLEQAVLSAARAQQAAIAAGKAVTAEPAPPKSAPPPAGKK